MRPGRPLSRGFTLLELMVALFVSAVMFAIGYGAITQALTNRDRVRTQQLRLNELQRTMRVLTQDFAQAVPRPVRDLLGSGDEPAFRADPRIATLVSLTRGGLGNFAGLQRPTQQRVEYSFENGALVRTAWPVLDRTQGTQPSRRELLHELRSVKLRYMNAARQWVEQWPPDNLPAGPERLRARPIAVEIQLDTADFGSITRLVEVPG
ncbi:MAG: type II secretion system minor pseudopilin GspJ [Steroidobacteraceae bacterium]